MCQISRLGRVWGEILRRASFHRDRPSPTRVWRSSSSIAKSRSRPGTSTRQACLFLGGIFFFFLSHIACQTKAYLNIVVFTYIYIYILHIYLYTYIYIFGKYISIDLFRLRVGLGGVYLLFI